MDKLKVVPPYPFKRSTIALADHIGQLDRTARAVHTNIFNGAYQTVYQTSSGFVAALGNGIAFHGFFPDVQSAREAIEQHNTEETK
jgi:hypothetical protein